MVAVRKQEIIGVATFVIEITGKAIPSIEIIGTATQKIYIIGSILKVENKERFKEE